MAESAPPPTALAGTRWAGWRAQRIAGDASARRYWRLVGGNGGSAILVDNGAAHGAGIDAFLDIAARLRAAGFAAPECLHLTEGRRFAVLEDLGPVTLAAHLAAAPAEEATLYADLACLIAALRPVPTPDGLARLTPEIGADMLDPFFEHAAPGTDPALRADLRAAIRNGLHRLAPGPPGLSLRDFHAENVIWRPGRRGHDRFGLIDFQDAFLAPPEYDLASLLRDARRDVGADAAEAAIAAFATRSGRNRDVVSAATAMLAVQRNLRILGIFERLIRTAGKPRYADFLPRVRRLIEEDLTHPALADLAGPIRAALRTEAP